MVDLVQWMTACLDEDERIARRACEYAEASWRLDEDGETVLWWPPEPRVAAKEREHGLPMVSDRWRGQTIASGGERIAPHVAVWDPARVLREIDAKRRLLAELLPEPTGPETDAELHARMAHPAFEYRTTEGPRKQWDHADTPPTDDEGEPEPGWERNVEAGRNGWERWDYTEESYWRRRLPEGRERKPEIPRWLRLLALPYADRDGYQEFWRP